MARSVTFNGITRFTPGGITRINAAALAQVTLGDNSIIGLIGEADGGAPGDEGGLVTFFDPSRAADVYKSGPVVDALNLAFQASNDPDVPGGASRVYVWKTNSSTQATLSLPAEPGEVLVPADGDITDLPTVSALGTTTTLIDTAGLAAFDVEDEFVGDFLVHKPFTADVQIEAITAYDASASQITVGNDLSGATAISDEYLVVKNQARAIGVPTGGSVEDLIDSGAAFGTSDELVGKWLLIQQSASVAYLRQILSHDDNTLTFYSAPNGAPLPVAPNTQGWYQVLGDAIDLTSADWGAHTNGITVDFDRGTSAIYDVATVEFEDEEEVSPDLGGKVFFKTLYKGGAIASDTVDTTPASTTTVIQVTTGGLTPDAFAGHQILVGDEYSVIASHTADVITLDSAYPLSVAPSSGTVVDITPVVGGYMEITGANGVATTYNARVFGANNATPLDSFSFTFTNNMTLRQLMAEINATANFEAVAATGVNLDTTLVKDFDYGRNTRTSMNGVLVSPSLFTNFTGEGATRNLMAVVDYFNDFSEFVNAARAADTNAATDGSGRVYTTPAATAMTGGSRGATSNSDFQAGFDELLKLRCNSVVPLIDEDLTNEGNGSDATVASVAAQAAAHCAVARGAAQDTAGERGAFVGFRGTKAQIIDQANALNDQDVALVCQNPTTLDRTGTLVEFGPRMLAVIGASMRAGVQEVAEPLTHKLLRVSGLTQDSSWDPSDRTDANEMIINGVLFAESIDGTGTRWVRDLTTWVADDNLAFSEGSVRDAVRFVAYGLRTTLVERFTGKKATPATIANVKDAAATYLELTRQDNIIVDSTDPATGEFVKAYHNLKVTSSGDTVSINVGIFPVPGINFQLTDIFLQLPTQSA